MQIDMHFGTQIYPENFSLDKVQSIRLLSTLSFYVCNVLL